MPTISQTTCILPYHAPVPLTSLPLVFHRDHLFPFTSYGDTMETATPRELRLIVIENAQVRVSVCPDLGGRIMSFFDKISNKELLFRNPVVKPIRILPIWAFISGGIEFNFPIAHSPTSIDAVGFSIGHAITPNGEYAYIRVGEREAKTGMEWVVEIGLLDNHPILVQRTALRNQTAHDHPWMMWTNCAVPSTPDTEFIYPHGPALRHNLAVSDITWPSNGSNWLRNIGEMTGFFWKPSNDHAFGVYHHDTGSGLLHLADPLLVPGKKLWTYGLGDDAAWARASTDGQLSYCEIQSGPLDDQNQKPMFPSGDELRFEEYWIPARNRSDLVNPPWPNLTLPDWSIENPWLGHSHSPWQCEWEAFRHGDGPLPSSAVPTGMELEMPLRAAQAHEPLALWLISRGRASEALLSVASLMTPTAQRLAGLICWKTLDDPDRAAVHLRRGPLDDPIAIIELDQVLSILGHSDERQHLLDSAPAHRMIIERQADLALTQNQPAEALRLLRITP